MNQLTQPLLSNLVEGESIEMAPITQENHQQAQSSRSPQAPQVPQVPQVSQVPQPGVNPNQETLKCAGCSQLLRYQKGAYAVRCDSCSTITAAVPISKIKCSKCSRELLCPAFALYVSCPCGKVLGNQFLPRR